MNKLQQLRSFYRRRINIPVDSSSLVLDIGSGDKPHWRADVLLDKYIDDSYGEQRSGSKHVAFTKPLVVADIAKMPFKDKVFDYIICSHILEHVEDPTSAIKEIIRVGKAGYIEVPFEGSAKVRDIVSHLWYCRMDGKKLVFTAKKQVAFDPIIDSLIQKPEILLAWDKLGIKFFDDFTIQLQWKNNIPFEVYGKANPKIVKHTESKELSHNDMFLFVRNIVNLLLTLPQFNKIRRKKISLIDIMQCNNCKGVIDIKGEKGICLKCHRKVTIIQ